MYNYIIFSLFFKGYIHILKQLYKNLPYEISVAKELESATDCFHYKPPNSSQYFQVVKLRFYMKFITLYKYYILRS
jgi:predicted nucleic acid-binding protein